MSNNEERGLVSGINNSSLRRQKERFIEESNAECDFCCDCCNYRCWAIFLLIVKIIANIGVIVFGAWAVNAWSYGAGFGAVVLLVSIST